MIRTFAEVHQRWQRMREWHRGADALFDYRRAKLQPIPAPKPERPAKRAPRITIMSFGEA